MGTIATGGHAERRRPSLRSALALGALALSLGWGMASQAPRLDGRVRPAASEPGPIESYAAHPRGRPHAYHSTTRAPCAEAITLPKRGKVCIAIRGDGRQPQR
jgi:hypothetical protein